MDEPIRPGTALLLTPAQVQAALGYGPTKVWAMIDFGELESFRDSSRRRITARSVQAYIERKLAALPSKISTPTTHLRQRRADSDAAA